MWEQMVNFRHMHTHSFSHFFSCYQKDLSGLLNVQTKLSFLAQNLLLTSNTQRIKSNPHHQGSHLFFPSALQSSHTTGTPNLVSTSRPLSLQLLCLDCYSLNLCMAIQISDQRSERPFLTTKVVSPTHFLSCPIIFSISFVTI